MIDINLGDTNDLKISDSDYESFNGKLSLEEHIDWEKKEEGQHHTTLFTSINLIPYMSERIRKYGRGNNDFFSNKQKLNLLQCFILFMTTDMLEDIAM